MTTSSNICTVKSEQEDLRTLHLARLRFISSIHAEGDSPLQLAWPWSSLGRGPSSRSPRRALLPGYPTPHNHRPFTSLPATTVVKTSLPPHPARFVTNMLTVALDDQLNSIYLIDVLWNNQIST